MAKIKVGFDIGSCSMKIAVAKGESFRVETVRLPNNMISEDGGTLPNIFPQFLRQTVKELHIPAGPAALSLPVGQAICRLVTLPEMSREQLELNLPYEFADFIQGSPEQYFCDYAMCEPVPGDEEGTMTMMAATASRQRLEDYVRMFAAGGIRLKKLVPPEMALIELGRSREEKTMGNEFCFVDLGHLQIRITIVAGDRVQASRTLQIGGREFDLAIADALGVEEYLAGTYKMAGNQSAMAVPLLQDLYQRLAVEILKVVNFYQFTYRSNMLDGVYLVGGGASIEALRNTIEGTVGLKLLDPARLLGTASGEASDGVFAAGAALG